METEAPYCTSLSASEASACKLALLDGENSKPVEIITTEASSENARDTFNVCRHDKVLFSGVVCTAWAFLLRCYTGQDRVTFEYATDRANATPYLLGMRFEYDEILSKYTESARDAIVGIEQKRLGAETSSAATVHHDKGSSLVNTTVCIYDSEMPQGMLAAKKTLRSMEAVSG